MKSFEDRLKSLGYSGSFYQNGQLWGFQDAAAMPAPIPQEIIEQAVEQDRLDRLAEWPNFSKWQRVRLWCDRIWNNIRVSSEAHLKLEDTVIKAKRSLILGNYRLKEKPESSYERNICREIAEHWQAIIIEEIDLEYAKIGKTGNPAVTPDFPVQVSKESKDFSLILNQASRNPDASEKILGIVCKSLKSLSKLTILDPNEIDTWIICNCERDLADWIAAETGFPPQYFYALHESKFWIYYPSCKQLILGGAIDHDGFWRRVYRNKIISGYLPQKFIFASILIVLARFLPASIISGPVGSLIVIVVVLLQLIFAAQYFYGFKKKTLY